MHADRFGEVWAPGFHQPFNLFLAGWSEKTGPASYMLSNIDRDPHQ